MYKIDGMGGVGGGVQKSYTRTDPIRYNDRVKKFLALYCYENIFSLSFFGTL